MKTAEEIYINVQDIECPNVNNLTLPEDWQIKAMKEYAKQIAEQANPNPKTMKRLDQQWMCVIINGDNVGTTAYNTLQWTRKESIAKMIENKSGRPVYSWTQLRSFGWRCIKVYISFDEPTKIKLP